VHPIQRTLRHAGHTILRQRAVRYVSMAVLATTAYLSLYFLAVAGIQSMSMTMLGLAAVPLAIGVALAVALPRAWWQLRNPREVARFLEEENPELQLSVRTSLDFLEGRSTEPNSDFHKPYLTQTEDRLTYVTARDKVTRPWGRMAFLSAAICLTLWSVYGDTLRDKLYNPTRGFGQTHLDLAEGSITIFEPEYTQVPGRTLALEPGVFNAYPGSKVRFLIQLPEGVRELFLSTDDGEPIPMRLNEEGVVGHELVLLESRELRFLMDGDDGSGRTEPFRFEVKTDEIPEIQLRSYTPEGPINVMDPLIIETEVKDDFGVKDLEAVVSWREGEKRIPITVPPNRKKHFMAKNRWYLSDFDLGDAETFSIYFEAQDNNPINGPGIGRSGTLTYELESPDKKYDEFMTLARELLDTMVHTLGDNLESELTPALDQGSLARAEAMGKSIAGGLYRSLTLTNTLISKVRETPNLTRLDQTFLYDLRNGISKQARARSDMALLFSSIQFRNQRDAYARLVNDHRAEELRMEDLTYELLLQLKMWAVFEMERQNNKIQEELDQMEELLENADSMEEDELMALFDKLMEQVMSDFQDMMTKAAQEMDQDLQEFMNSDAMRESTDMIEELKKQIMEALKEGDLEKAKALMEELRAQMQSAYQQMQSQIGEMSPEMQAMMKDMRELMGLLRELKTGEEGLEQATRDLKKRMDEAMGGNEGQMSEADKQEHREITENIHRMLTELYNQLVAYNTQDLSESVLRQINEAKQRLESDDLGIERREQLIREIASQERMLDFLSRDGLDRLQNETLRNIEQTERLQEYLDQGELLLSLETGMGLESNLLNSERLAERTASRELREEARPSETFRDARLELNEIMRALQNIRNDMEEARRQFMEQQGSEEGQQLAERQAELERMIQELMDRTSESFGGSQIEERLNEIRRSMRNAQRGLGQSRLESGLTNEQEALQRIGEMMEQLQQSSQPNGGRGMPMSMRREGHFGDPLLEDIYIPESEKKASRDKMKDEIRKRLGKNLPEAYGKEIRKYYDKLMDQ